MQTEIIQINRCASGGFNAINLGIYSQRIDWGLTLKRDADVVAVIKTALDKLIVTLLAAVAVKEDQRHQGFVWGRYSIDPRAKGIGFACGSCGRLGQIMSDSTQSGCIGPTKWHTIRQRPNMITPIA